MTLRNFDGIHDTEGAAVLPYVQGQLDPSVSWDDLAWLVSASSIPVVVKGVLRGDDAKRAVDTAITEMDALVDVVPSVDGQVPVYVDGGIRRGTDVLKAIAMGANAVVVGRPIEWGLAVGGEDGVVDVIEILRREFDTALALCGCSSVTDIGSELLV